MGFRASDGTGYQFRHHTVSYHLGTSEVTDLRVGGFWNQAGSTVACMTPDRCWATRDTIMKFAGISTNVKSFALR